MTMYSAAIYFLPIIAVVAAKTPCFPCNKAACNNPDGLSCPGGIVYDNKDCPCCFRCAKQENEYCSPREVQDNPNTNYHYCDEGLACETFTNSESSLTRAQGVCKGKAERKCPYGEKFSKGCMECTCTEGRVSCEINARQLEQCPITDFNKPPPCPQGDYPRPSPETCCNVCVVSCPGKPGEPESTGSCEDFAEIVRSPPERLAPVHGEPFSFYFEVLGSDVAYEIKEPSHGASLTVEKVDRAEEKLKQAITVDRVTVTGYSPGIYTICYGKDNKTSCFEVTVENAKRPGYQNNCDFENDMCNMKSYSKAGLTWMRKRGPTAITGYSESDYYAHVDSWPPARENDTVYLCTPKMMPQQMKKIMKFAYRLYGTHVGSLSVRQTLNYGKHAKKHEKGQHYWGFEKDQCDEWKWETIVLTPLGNAKSTTICFIALVGKSGDIAIDDIKFM